jgi:hypothetical protein
MIGVNMNVAKLIVTGEELALLIKLVSVYKNMNIFTNPSVDKLLSELIDLKEQLDLIGGAE